LFTRRSGDGSQDLNTLPNDLIHGENDLPNDDRLSTHRNSAGYSFDGLPKLSNASGGGTKSQASTASSSATRDSGISVTDAQRAADENRLFQQLNKEGYLNQQQLEFDQG
jgi:hypothetical protein